jgi:hypothetical protein
VGDIYSADIKGISSNSVDSLESLSEAAQLALASMAQFKEMNKLDIQPKADSYFNELLSRIDSQNERTHSRVKRHSYEPTDRINSIFYSYEKLASEYGRKNCDAFSESERRLPGDVIYGVNDQFESQSRLALSISHFLSSFYQIINPEEDFPLRNAEKAISEDQLYAEVISAIAADFKVSPFQTNFKIKRTYNLNYESNLNKGCWRGHLLRSQQVQKGQSLFWPIRI